MDTLLEGGEQLELELTPEPIALPALGSLLLHGALAGGLAGLRDSGGLFHHDLWGSPGGGGAIQVTLTTALPLPSDQPPNQNVLATETPSQAPAEPAPKAKQAVDETAIPIAGKQKKPEQQARPKRNSTSRSPSRTIWPGSANRAARRCRGRRRKASGNGR
jgi:protein TonB